MRYQVLIWVFFWLHGLASAQFVSKHYEAQELQIQAGLLFESLQKDLSGDWRADVDLYLFKEGGFNVPVLEIALFGQPNTAKEGGSIQNTHKNYVTMWMFDRTENKKLRAFLSSLYKEEDWMEFTETKNCLVYIVPTEKGSAKKEDKDVQALRVLLQAFLKKNSEKL